MSEKISVCMIIKNEEKFLENCLSNIQDLADEIIIVDTGSTDKSIEIAKKFTDKIFNFEWCDDFSKARNFSLEKASGNWILSLDADEIISKEDRIKLRKIAELNEAEGFFLNWRNYTNEAGILGWISSKNDNYSESKIASGFVALKVLRFFKKGFYFEGKIHETVDNSIKNKGGKIFDTDVVIHHLGGINNNIEKKQGYIDLLKRRLENRDFEEKTEDYILFEIGNELISLNRHFEAIEYLEKAIEIKSEYAYVSLLGICYLLDNRLDDGEKMFIRAINLSSLYPPYDYKNPQKFNIYNPSIYNNLGAIYYKRGLIEKAIKKFEKSIELNPSLPDPYFNLGVIYHDRNNPERMRFYFDKSIELNFNYLDKIRKFLGI